MKITAQIRLIQNFSAGNGLKNGQLTAYFQLNSQISAAYAQH